MMYDEDKVSTVKVEPSGPLGAKILFVGEAPGEDEENEGRPFVGRAGMLLFNALERLGIMRDDVRVTNLCNYRPMFNKFEYCALSPKLREGKDELDKYIEQYPPELIVPLGSTPFYYFTERGPITKYRGSILDYKGIKLIGTLHPSYVLRSAENYPIFIHDLKRIAENSKYPDIRRRNRNYYIGSEAGTVIDKFLAAPFLTLDIETSKKDKQLLCHGFAISPEEAICLPHEPQFMSWITQLYESNAQKITHYGLFDIPMLQHHGYSVHNWAHDTYFQAHALEPELPRGLDLLTSLYTTEPYYKSTGRGEIPDDTKAWGEQVSKSELYIYNCKDAACTFEVFEEQLDELNKDTISRSVYEYEMHIGRIALEIGQVGMYIDEKKREKLQLALAQKWAKLQFSLNSIAIFFKHPFKKDEYEINVNSPGANGAVARLLYDTLKLPVRKKNNKV